MTEAENLYPEGDPDLFGNVKVSLEENFFGITPLIISTSLTDDKIVIDTTSLNDPYQGMIEWLENIVENHFPAIFIIEEEGRNPRWFIFWAAALQNGRLDFRIIKDVRKTAPDAQYAHLRKPIQVDETSPYVLRVIVRKRQLVSEFVKKLQSFLRTTYIPLQWSMYVDLRDLDFSRLKAYLHSNKE